MLLLDQEEMLMAKKVQLPEKISIGEVQDALERSGYLIENRIENILIKKKYLTDLNTYFPDPETNIPREIDILAFNTYRFPHKSQDNNNYLALRLLIECVNNPQPFALLPKEPGPFSIFERDVLTMGIPSSIFTENNSGPERPHTTFSLYCKLHKFHHSYFIRSSTQFCSFSKKQNKNKDEEWMASHNNSHYDCIKKLCNATNYYYERNLDYELTIKLEENFKVTMLYPVLVLQGELLDVDTSNNKINISKANHLQLSRHSIINGKQEIHRINVVTEEYFPQFLEILEDEANQIISLLEKNYSSVQDSVSSLVEQIKNTSDINQKRKLLRCL